MVIEMAGVYFTKYGFDHRPSRDDPVHVLIMTLNDGGGVVIFGISNIPSGPFYIFIFGLMEELTIRQNEPQGM